MTQPDVAPHFAPAHLAARTTPIDAPADLLDLVTPNGFTWIDGAVGFVAAGVAARIAPSEAVGFLRSIPHEHGPRHARRGRAACRRRVALHAVPAS